MKKDRIQGCIDDLERLWTKNHAIDAQGIVVITDAQVILEEYRELKSQISEFMNVMKEHNIN